MEEHIASHSAHIAVFHEIFDIALENVRVKRVADLVSFCRLKTVFFFQIVSVAFQIFRREQFARSYGNRFDILQNKLLQVFRETSFRLAHHTLEVGYYGIRESHVLGFFINILRSQLIFYHENGHVADHLGGRCYFDDVSHHIIDCLVHFLYIIEAMAQTKAFHLRLQIGILAPRNLIPIDFRASGFQIRFELGVYRSYRCPVIRKLLYAFQVDPGLSLCVVQRRHQRVQSRLTGQPGHAVQSSIYDVNACICSHQGSGAAVSSGVMGMKMDRN